MAADLHIACFEQSRFQNMRKAAAGKPLSTTHLVQLFEG